MKYTDFSQVRTPEQFWVSKDGVRERVCRAIPGIDEGDSRAARRTDRGARREAYARKSRAAGAFRGFLTNHSRRSCRLKFLLLQLLAEGYKHQEIANRMEWSYPQTGVRVFRLRAKVRNLLKEWGLPSL